VDHIEDFVITTFYKFISLTEIDELKLMFLKYCNAQKIKGTILLASEGVNATISGSREAIDGFYNFTKGIPLLTDLEFKESFCEYQPFKKMKVRIKKEIVTFKVENLNLSNRGQYLNSEQWDKLITSKDVMVIDTRNDYEIDYGSFKNAIDPKTKNFSDFPDWVEQNLSNEHKDKTILMYCTGGVRCEKSTAYLKQLGFNNVFHLKGGILKYLEESKNKNNLWHGSCYVFDDRYIVDSKLRSIKSTDV